MYVCVSIRHLIQIEIHIHAHLHTYIHIYVWCIRVQVLTYQRSKQTKRPGAAPRHRHTHTCIFTYMHTHTCITYIYDAYKMMHTSICVYGRTKEAIDNMSWRCSASLYVCGWFLCALIACVTGTWRIHTWWHGTFIYATRLTHICDMPPSYRWCDSFIYVLHFLVRLRIVIVHLDCLCERDVTSLYMWHDSSKSVCMYIYFTHVFRLYVCTRA